MALKKSQHSFAEMSVVIASMAEQTIVITAIHKQGVAAQIFFCQFHNSVGFASGFQGLCCAIERGEIRY